MDLMLTGEIAKHLFSLTKKDTKLAQALAQQLLDAIDPTAMAKYLLTTDIAKNLLAEKIKTNPEEALRALERLSTSRSGARKGAGRQGSRRGGKVAGTREGSAAGMRRGRRKRQRLTSDQINHIKDQVRSFLRHSPWSTRKQLLNHVDFPSVAAYNRIIAELKDSGDILARGEKSKTIYAVKGAAGTKARTTKRSETAASKSKKKSGKRQITKKGSTTTKVVKKTQKSVIEAQKPQADQVQVEHQPEEQSA